MMRKTLMMTKRKMVGVWVCACVWVYMWYVCTCVCICVGVVSYSLMSGFLSSVQRRSWTVRRMVWMRRERST